MHASQRVLALLSRSPKPERAATALRTTAFIFSALDGSLSVCHGGRRGSALLLQRGAVVGRFRYHIREEQSPAAVAAAVA